ncbi:hypothetical protein C2S52_016034 [Perilla frutescens var. hirtella]|nr:hypothetical protein C2S52_016034 [Perilla frutescens var. hirtella]
MMFGTAKDIWDAAKETYSSSENISELFQVESALHDFCQGEQSVYQYYNTFTRELDDVRRRVMGTKPLPGLTEAFSNVRHEKSRKKVAMGSKEQLASTFDASALVARPPNNNGGYSQKWERPWCEHCEKTNHFKWTCWKLHGKPAGWKSKPQFDRNNRAHVVSTSLTSNNVNVPVSSPFSKEQMEMLQTLFSQVGNRSITDTDMIAQTYPHAAHTVNKERLEIEEDNLAVLNCTLGSISFHVTDPHTMYLKHVVESLIVY